MNNNNSRIQDDIVWDGKSSLYVHEFFTNNELEDIRRIEINDVLYYSGEDVAKILGYKVPWKALLYYVDDKDKEYGVGFFDANGKE